MKLNHNLCVFMILAAIAVTYANSLAGGLVLDDYNLIADNPYIKNCAFLPVIFTTGFGRLDKLGSNYYRPIQELTYMADYFFWKEYKAGYHITNLWFFMGAALALFFLIEYIFKNIRLAFFSTLLFSVHPVNTSSVTYMSGRADIMEIFFILISFFILLKGLDSRQGKWRPALIAASLFFLLALLTKESAVVFMAAIFGCMAFGRKTAVFAAAKGRWPQIIIAFCAMLFLYAGLRLHALKTVFSPQYGMVTALDNPMRIFTALKAFGHYLLLLLVPVGLHFERTISPANSLYEPEVLIALILLCVMLYAVITLSRRNHPAGYGLLWFFVWFFPVSNIIVPLNCFIAENWIQLPAMGIFLAVAAVGAGACEKPAAGVSSRIIRWLIGLLFVAALIFYALLTIQRNMDYADPIVFYQKALRFEPGNIKFYNGLGVEYQRRNEIEAAVGIYRKALAIAPKNMTALNNSANIFSALGRDDEAIDLYAKALAQDPENTLFLNNLGVAYIRKSDVKRALACWKRSLEINPNQPQIKQYVVWNQSF